MSVKNFLADLRRFANLHFGGDQAKALKYLNKKQKVKM